jgi:hypothetical protein
MRQRSQLVGVGDSAGQQQRSKIAGLSIVQRHVYVEFVRLVMMVPTLDLAPRGRDDLSVRAGFLQSLAGLRHFDLLKPVGHQDGDFQSAQS